MPPRTAEHSPVAPASLDGDAQLRRAVADGLAAQREQRRESGMAPLDSLDEQQLARSILQRAVDQQNRNELRAGGSPIPDAARAALVDRVLAQVFSTLPGLDAFLSMNDALNIHVHGCRHVTVEHLDGSRHRHPSPFSSDREVIELLAHVARRSGTVEKEFNFSHPMLHLALPDGSRLTANAWIGAEPHLTIRRHPLVDHDLDDLMARQMFSDEVRSLLAAAVRARLNVLVAGGQGTGKTTLLRACLHECGVDERVLVLESEPELHLDHSPERHREVITLCERPSNMEGDGAVTLAELVWHAKRLTPERIVVGEVLADEVIPMLEAMSQGVRGSWCTIHAPSSAAIFPRLPVYARSRGRDWRSEDVLALAALALDLVVFIGRDATDRRVVAEVRHVHGYDPEGRQVVSDAWFTPHPTTGRATRTGIVPRPLLDLLRQHGYAPARRDELQGRP